MENSNIEIYTDGGCSVHSGKVGCWAYVVVLGDEAVGENFGVVPDTTNGKMEVLAMKEALKYALDYCALDGGKVTIKSDSQYCVNAYNSWCKNWANNKWRKSNNKPVEHVEHWQEMNDLRHERVAVEWVKAHNNNKWNDYVDMLCKNR